MCARNKVATELGAGYKIFYYGINAKRNGVGITLDSELKSYCPKIKRESDRTAWLPTRGIPAYGILSVLMHPKFAVVNKRIILRIIGWHHQKILVIEPL